MKFTGVQQRAYEARDSLKRLRLEVTRAIEEGRADDAAHRNVAEVAGILADIFVALEQAPHSVPADVLQHMFGTPRARFVDSIITFNPYARRRQRWSVDDGCQCQLDHY